MEQQGQFVNIGSRNLFARVQGSGPSIVLCSGADTPGVGAWEPIVPLLIRFATVVTYDRAGIGRSDLPPAAPSAADMVDDLHLLLNALGTSKPAVLVGRSLGALPAQLYACSHPADVSGLLLLDPTPDQMFTGYHAPAGKTRLASTQRRGAQQKAGEHSRLEWQRMTESCAQVRRAIEEERKMPNIQVIVLTAATRAEMGTAASIAADSLTLAHQHMAGRVPNGRLVTAAKGSHQTIVAEESEVVVRLIETLLA